MSDGMARDVVRQVGIRLSRRPCPVPGGACVDMAGNENAGFAFLRGNAAMPFDAHNHRVAGRASTCWCPRENTSRPKRPMLLRVGAATPLA